MTESVSHINTCLPLDSISSMRDHNRNLDHDEMADAKPTLNKVFDWKIFQNKRDAVFTNFDVVQKLTSVDVDVRVYHSRFFPE